MNDMKKIISEWRKYVQLNESGLSRLYTHMMEHDCAILTAFRGDANDMTQCTKNALAPEEGENNKTRNRDLKATLLVMKIGETKVDGSYVEDFDTPIAKEVSEASLFCVNLNDDSGFVETIKSLGEKYCQDSVLIIPKGGKGAYLVGTNNAEFPGLGQSMNVGDVKWGSDAEFMTRIRNKPMTFADKSKEWDGINEVQEVVLETYKDLSRNQRMAVMAVTNRFLSEIKK